MFLNDMKNILPTDYLLRFYYFTYSRGKYILTLMIAWQLICWKDARVGAKYTIFRIETLFSSTSLLNDFKD